MTPHLDALFARKNNGETLSPEERCVMYLYNMHRYQTSDAAQEMVKLTEEAAGRLAEKEKRIADLLKSNHEEVDEFNAGYEAYKAGLDLEDAERTYGDIQHELGIPSHDTFSTGYAWAKFQAAALREGSG